MQRIAIIGAGASGLTSAVAALEENIIPCIFEMSHRLGGVWAPDQRDAKDLGSAWPGMKVNISRHTGTFSNFSWNPEAPDFPCTEEVYNYLKSYATHFGILPYIRFGCRVNQVSRLENKWLIRWKENEASDKEELFDALIIASSKFTNPHIPDFKGLDTITKHSLHSAQYKSANQFSGQKVLIVGGSLSGTSIAEEVAKQAEVIHLFRKPRWVIKRYRSCDPKNNGPLLPRDLLKTWMTSQNKLSKEQQYENMLQHCSEQNEYVEWRMHPDTPTGFVVADNYFDAVHQQKIHLIRGEIDYFLESRVVLKDSREIKFDTVIFCTGYVRHLGFLPPDLRINPSSPLYEDTFPFHANNIAFIGMYPGARGAVFPLVELQARYVCGVFSGRLKLPSTQVMKESIRTQQDRDEMQFSTSLAQKIGVLPDVSSYNSGLQHILLNGSFTPMRFRLTGPHSNFELASTSLLQTEIYRRKLIRANEKVPSLSSMCLFKLDQQKEVNQKHFFHLLNHYLRK